MEGAAESSKSLRARVVVDREDSESIQALRRRVAELETELRRRSRQVVLLLDRLPPDQYPIAERILEGLPLSPRFALQPGEWAESTELLPADVEEVLADLWDSVVPPSVEKVP